MTRSQLYEMVNSLLTEYDVDDVIKYLDDYLSELSADSLYSYIDKNGVPSQRELRAQIELVTRGISGEYYSELMDMEADFLGTDLILFSAHKACSKACMGDQGTVVSKSGKTKGYKSKEDAKADGFYHFGNYGTCKHVESPYIDGFTQIPDEWSKWTEKEIKEAYAKEQAMRYNERTIRKYKKMGRDDLVKVWLSKPHDKYRI